MSRAAAIRPVAEITRTVFPQTSAHQALCGLPEANGVGQISKAPAFVAVSLWDDYPSPASAFLRSQCAVEDSAISSQVKCSWSWNGAWCTVGSVNRCSRGTDEG